MKIAVSTFFSAVNSLTFSPALSGLLLRPKHEQRNPLSRLSNALLGWFFKLFNRGFNLGADYYSRGVSLLLRGSFIVLLAYGGLLFLTYVSFTSVPTGFIPQQDKGYLLVNVRLPDSVSLERTEAGMAQIDEIARGQGTSSNHSVEKVDRDTQEEHSTGGSIPGIAPRLSFPDSHPCRTRLARTTVSSTSF